MNQFRVSQKTADFMHPSPYEVWRAYVKGSTLENRIGPWKFALFLHKNHALEIFNYKREGTFKCKIINANQIPRLMVELRHSSWLSPLSWVSQLARRWRQMRDTTRGSTQSKR